jgi:hypothetical protein
MKWPGQARAKLERDAHMSEARECVRRHRETLDPVYLEAAKIHVRTARAFNRHVWRGPTNGTR